MNSQEIAPAEKKDGRNTTARLHVAFSSATREELEGIQRKSGRSMADMLVSAARLFNLFLEVQREGGTLMVQNKDGSIDRLRVLV